MKLPLPLKWLRDAWMTLSRVIGYVMSKIVLTLLWIIVFGMYAVLLKAYSIFRRPSTRSSSLWIPLPPDDPAHLKRQF